MQTNTAPFIKTSRPFRLGVIPPNVDLGRIGLQGLNDMLDQDAKRRGLRGSPTKSFTIHVDRYAGLRHVLELINARLPDNSLGIARIYMSIVMFDMALEVRYYDGLRLQETAHV